MACRHPRRKPKTLPYGATRGVFWCRGCDREMVPDWRDKPIKKQARQRAKRAIKKEE